LTLFLSRTVLTMRRFAGPIIVASADGDCQAAVVKAGADYAIPKSAIRCLLFHIHTS